ncbi:MAG: acetylglutamate kinase [Phycisphaerales bacterium]|nr:acetylglutamate kinase [Phycisphaerales bacterium]
MHSATLVKHHSNGQSHSNWTERTGPLLVKLGGAAIDRAEDNPALFQALCDLHKSLRAEGQGVVLIHGGGAAVDRRLERLGLVSQRRDGIRLTPPEHIDEVVAALAGSTNTQVVGLIQRSGVPAVGLSLGDGFVARSAKATGYSFDPGCVGEISGGDPRLIHLLIDSGYMPVLCSIGLDEQGEPLNINADDAAAGLAGLIGCRGLVLLTDVPGVLDRDGALIDELTAAEIEEHIASGVIKGGMIPKVRGALQAAQAARTPVTIMSWSDAASLAGLSHGQPAGTRILPGELAGAASTDTGASYSTTPWSDLL